MRQFIMKHLQFLVVPFARVWVKYVYKNISADEQEIERISGEVTRMMSAFGYDVNKGVDLPHIKIYPDMTKTMPGVLGAAYPAAGIILVPQDHPSMEVLYHEIAHHYQSGELIGIGSVGTPMTIQQYSELEFEIQAWTVQAASKMLVMEPIRFWEALETLALEGPVDLLDLATELDLVDHMRLLGINIQDISQWIRDYILGV